LQQIQFYKSKHTLSEGGRGKLIVGITFFKLTIIRGVTIKGKMAGEKAGENFLLRNVQMTPQKYNFRAA